MSLQPKRKPQVAVDIDEIHDNTSTELINITSDKLKLILIDHTKKIQDASSWQAPLGMLVTIILVFCSAQFQAAFGIPADTWRAIFLIGCALSVLWLIWALFKIRNSTSVDDLISVIKNK